eukprot:151325-Chlamydomonas_euryale.AAC.7
MQHNPYEIGQPWRPPGGLYLARQCGSSFVCPPLRSRPQTFVNLLKMPNLLLAAAAAAVPDGHGHLSHDISNALDALAREWVDCLNALRRARPVKF